MIPEGRCRTIEFKLQGSGLDMRKNSVTLAAISELEELSSTELAGLVQLQAFLH